MSQRLIVLMNSPGSLKRTASIRIFNGKALAEMIGKRGNLSELNSQDDRILGCVAGDADASL
jgi:hypothetical protein